MFEMFETSLRDLRKCQDTFIIRVGVQPYVPEM